MLIKTTKSQIVLMKDIEGIVCLGTGGDVYDWITGVNGLMVEEGITSIPEVFTEVYQFQDGDINCLLFVFPKTPTDFNVGRLAMVRLQYNWMKWLSDYISNNIQDFEFEDEDEYYDEQDEEVGLYSPEDNDYDNDIGSGFEIGRDN